MSNRMSKREIISILYEYGYDKSELREMSLEELRDLYEEVVDESLSDMLPNETYGEYMEHEDY